MTKWVYSFGDGQADGDASMRDLLGGKGANLAEMSAVGLPVPPGFTITNFTKRHLKNPDGSIDPERYEGVVDTWLATWQPTDPDARREFVAAIQA